MTPFNPGIQDDPKITISRDDASGGTNNRQHASQIKENQFEFLYNIDINIPGETRKRPGYTLLEDLGDNNAGLGCLAFHPIESTNTNELLVWHGQKLEGWASGGSFVEHKTDITTGGEQTHAFQAFRSGSGSCVLFKNTTDSWYQYDPNDSPVVTVLTDSGNTNPPSEATVGTFYRGRAWLMGNNYAWFSSAYPSSFATAFDQTTNAYNIPVGQPRAIVGIRDTGMVFLGSQEIWGLNPSSTPVATDKPEKLLDIGCVAGKTAQLVGDDVLFLAPDGIRGLFRTIQDKLQLTQSFPLSFVLRDEFESISWGSISKATAIWFDNKYFIALPVDGSTYNNQVWIYYPSYQAWTVITGWNVGDWDVLNYSGQDRLYFIEANDDIVHRGWTGYSDNGTAINYQEEGRKEDCGQPLINKVGGELEIKAFASGNYDLAVYASIDEGDYTSLGTMNLSSGAPTLPVNLPFNLVNSNVTRKKFHLDSLGEWKILQTKIQHNATNGSDDIKVYSRNLVTYPTEYQGE